MNQETDQSQALELPVAQTPERFSLVPKTLKEAQEYAAIISKSDMVPKDFRGKPANCMIAMQMGIELGIPPLQAIQNIAVINGRPALWGDMLPALARSRPDFEYLSEDFDEESQTAICRAKRRNEPEQMRTFSMADAKTAGLWGKQGPWKQYPKRMLQMRARGFAVRDVFPDAVKGLSVAEDIIDMNPQDYSRVQPGRPQRVSKPAPVSNTGVIDETEDDDQTEADPDTINDDQILAIVAYIDENDLDENKWLDFIEKRFGSREIRAIPTAAYDRVMSALKKAAMGVQEDAA